MDKKLSIAQLVLQVLVVGLLVVVIARSGGQAQFQQQAIGDWTTNFGAIEADVPTTQPTAYPGLIVEMKGVGNALELRNASSTPVFYVSNAGAVTYNTSTVCETCMKITGATAATTATPAFMVNNAADVNDLLAIAKDGSTVFIIGNGGAITRSGADTLTGSLIQTGHQIVTGPTAATTGTPVVLINAASDANELLVVMKDAAAVFTIGNSGAITRAGADTLTGSLVQTGHIIVTGPTTAVTGTPVVRVNAASDVNDLFAIAKDGTDEVLVDNSGDLDMTGNIISNIGNTGTDFNTSGGLTTASSVVVSSGGITVTAGGLSLAGNNRLVCTYAEEVAATNENLSVAAPCYVIAVSTSVNADYTLQTANIVTGTMVYVTQIGAGTLVITDTNLISSDGNAISLGANDSAGFIFDGAKWNGLFKLAGS